MTEGFFRHAARCAGVKTMPLSRDSRRHGGTAPRSVKSRPETKLKIIAQLRRLISELR
jgi:hypothetical protein